MKAVSIGYPANVFHFFPKYDFEGPIEFMNLILKSPCSSEVSSILPINHLLLYNLFLTVCAVILIHNILHRFPHTHNLNQILRQTQLGLVDWSRSVVFIISWHCISSFISFSRFISASVVSSNV